MKRAFFFLTVLLTLFSISTVQAEIGDRVASKIINNQNQTIGHAYFTQGSEGVLINIKVHDLPPGKHGMHFHEKGTCKDFKAFKLTGGHIMPSGRPHGYLNPEGPHEGNLPNLVVQDDGTAEVELYSSLVSLNKKNKKPNLLDEDGSTLIIHANEDDHATQPIGGSGARIACGVIAASTE